MIVPETLPTKPSKKNRSQLMLLLFGGVLPVIAFTLFEEFYGVIWGTIAGMAFGFGEVIYEKVRLKKVNGITWFSNALILVLGGITLISEDGFWFKMQPALFLYAFAIALVVSSLIKKPLMVALTLKQNPDLPPQAIELIKVLNLRLGFVFLALGALSTWAAFSWSTEAWAFLKSVGVLIILAFYMAAELIIRRMKNRR